MDKILFTVSIVVIVVGYCILLLLLFYPTRLNDSPAMLLTFFPSLSLSLFPFSLLLALILFSKWSLMYYTFSVCEFIYTLATTSYNGFTFMDEAPFYSIAGKYTFSQQKWMWAIESV